MPEKRKRGRPKTNRVTQNRYTGSRYSADEWALVKSEYQSGKVKSFRELYDVFTKSGIKCPSETAMKIRAAREGDWDKAINAPLLEEAHHKKMLRVFERIGVTDEKVATVIADMLNASDYTAKNNALQRYMDLAGTRAPHKVARTDDDGNAANETVFVVPANGFEPAST